MPKRSHSPPFKKDDDRVPADLEIKPWVALDVELKSLRQEEARLISLLRKVQHAAAKLELSITRLSVDRVVIYRVPYGSIKEGILSLLAENPDGLTVAEIRERLRKALVKDFHPRAPNSALTRLKESGLVVRVGRRWKATI